MVVQRILSRGHLPSREFSYTYKKFRFYWIISLNTKLYATNCTPSILQPNVPVVKMLLCLLYFQVRFYLHTRQKKFIFIGSRYWMVKKKTAAIFKSIYLSNQNWQRRALGIKSSDSSIDSLHAFKNILIQRYREW